MTINLIHRQFFLGRQESYIRKRLKMLVRNLNRTAFKVLSCVFVVIGSIPVRAHIFICLNISYLNFVIFLSFKTII